MERTVRQERNPSSGVIALRIQLWTEPLFQWTGLGAVHQPPRMLSTSVEESLNGNLRLCLTNFRKTHRPPEKIEIPCFMDVTTFLLSCDLFPSGRRRPERALSACTSVPSQTYIFSFMPSNMAAEHVVRSTDPKERRT